MNALSKEQAQLYAAMTRLIDGIGCCIHVGEILSGPLDVYRGNVACACGDMVEVLSALSLDAAACEPDNEEVAYHEFGDEPKSFDDAFVQINQYISECRPIIDSKIANPSRPTALGSIAIRGQTLAHFLRRRDEE